MPSPQRSLGHSLFKQKFSQKFLCFFVLFCFFVFCVFYFIKISKFTLPGVMLIYERTSKDRKKERCPNTLSLVSFAGMTLDKCIVLRIGTLTGCPLCRESHPLCRLKNPTVISIWLLVGFHPATRSVQCTPADNARKRAPGNIYRERKIISSVLKKL